ncbi:helix-turn-helix domain-containing protein [Streptomyces sp. SID13031]|uniref:helix-turn-helix domain-containing protein n=1 Tax=Streptomyces sp. SID13031 TaxID=2706046 RepID=UPI0031BA8DFB
MYDDEVRAAAMAAIASGESLNSISKRQGISRSTLRDWRDRPEPKVRLSRCPLCADGLLGRSGAGHLSPRTVQLRWLSGRELDDPYRRRRGQAV